MFARKVNKLIYALLFLTMGGKLASQVLSERGLLSIKNYSSKNYDAAPQNWAAIQDKRGVMYFANNNCVLEYDGKNWNKIKTTNESAVRSLAIDTNGRIFVGAKDDLGYLKPDTSGRMRFVSLTPLLNKNDREFGDVWKTIVDKRGQVFFQTSTKIFCWNGSSFKVWTAQRSFHQGFQVYGTIYFTQRQVGLMNVVDSALVLMQGGEAFAEERLYFMLPTNDQKNILLCTRDRGLMLMTPTDASYFPKDRKNPEQFIKVKEFKSNINSWLLQNPVYNAVMIDNRSYSIGTLSSGVVVIDNKGDLSFSLNKSSGLQDATIYHQLVDNNNNIWLSLNNGISHVDINSPITRFNDKNGLSGTVKAITRFNKQMYVATNQGVFVLESVSDPLKSETLEHANFKRIFNNESWDILPFSVGVKNVLLVSTNTGVYELDASRNAMQINQYNTSCLHQSKKDPNRIFIGKDDGITSIYLKNGKWINEPMVGAEVKEDVRSIAENEKGELWLGTSSSDLIKVTQRITEAGAIEYASQKMDKAKGVLGDGDTYVQNINGKIVIGTSRGIFKVSQSPNEEVVADTAFGKYFTDTSRYIHRIIPAPNNTVWIESIKGDNVNFGYFNSGKWNSTPFLPINGEIIHAIYPDSNGITWFGGPDGLYRFDKSINKSYHVPFNALVRKVVIGKDSILFNGNFLNANGAADIHQPDIQKPQLKYEFNSLTFFFAAPDFEDEEAMQYTYFLEGFDKQWSYWKNETKAVYTNLSEGKYFFHVKAKNIYGHESAEAVYEFVIDSPWYRTTLAYISYLLLLGAIVRGAVVFSTRRLRAIIAERTAEVVQQKELIELKNKDITDSINYAKRIQEAILPTKEFAKGLMPESFILFKPKDIVSGDFYWLTEKDGKVLVAAADCTGHGVPGAFMSMIGNALLNEIVNDKNITKPSDILEHLRDGVIKALKQTGAEGENKDGMDIALISLDFKNMKIQYAGAYNPLVLVRNKEVIEVKADKCPIGISGHNVNFTNHEIDCEKGDIAYIFSDGYADQFGGPQGKKLMRKKMKDIFISMQGLSMDKQGQFLNSALADWQGTYSQVDDVLVIGVKI